MTIGKTVYEHYNPAGKGAGLFPLVSGCRVLEVGFGSGDLLRALAGAGNEVYGVDAGQDIVDKAKQQGLTHVFRVDVSEEPLPFDADFFEAVYCYEVLEHLTNPHRLFFEIRRVLKRDHVLYFSVPAQEVDMGYGQLRHTFVYPGLLEKHNLERFFMQMYFRIDRTIDAGPTDWLLGHNYALINKKDDRKPDVVEVIIKDMSVYELYQEVLSPEALTREVGRELSNYAVIMEDCVKRNDMASFEEFLKFNLNAYPKEYPFFIRFAQRLIARCALLPAAKILDGVFQKDDVPLSVKQEIKGVLEGIMADFSSKRPAAPS